MKINDPDENYDNKLIDDLTAMFEEELTNPDTSPSPSPSPSNESFKRTLSKFKRLLQN